MCREGKGQGYLSGLGEPHSLVSVSLTLILFSGSHGLAFHRLAFYHLSCSLRTAIINGRSTLGWQVLTGWHGGDFRRYDATENKQFINFILLSEMVQYVHTLECL